MTEHSSPVTATALKRCPFCGGSATMEQTGDNRWSVGCDSAEEPTCMGYQSFTTFARQGEASVAWNRRSAPAQCVPSRIDKGRAFYLAMYEKDGAIWAANDHKELWCDMAEDYERRLSPVTSTVAPAQCAPMPDRALLLIQQLAWYYDVNDCSERHEDDALEVPLLDLRAAKEIAAELNLPDGPVPVQRSALTSTVAPAQCAWRPIETAAKDRSRILLWQADRGAFEGWWHDGWPSPESYWMDDADSEPEPTHWRPLLPAPQMTVRFSGGGELVA